MTTLSLCGYAKLLNTPWKDFFEEGLGSKVLSFNRESLFRALGHSLDLPYMTYIAVSSNKTFHNKHTGRTKTIQSAGIVYTSPEEHHLNVDSTNCARPGENGE